MKTYRFQQLKPCKARGTLREEIWDSKEWSADTKYDGDRRIAQFCKDGVRFTGCRTSVKDGLYVEKSANVPHLSKHGLNSLVMLGTVLDGEMLAPWPGARSKDTCAIMGSLPAEAVRKQQERGWLRYVVFDCLFCRGQDVRGMPLYSRRAMAIKEVAAWGNKHVDFAEVELYQKREFLQEVWRKGGEGIILKRNDSEYGDEKAWVKVKKELTDDCVIMGYEWPKATSKKKDGTVSANRNYANGWISAILIGQYKAGKLVSVGKCSGLGDTERQLYSGPRGKALVGTVIEVKGNDREPSGKFRHPEYVRPRPDKNAKDCKWGVR